MNLLCNAEPVLTPKMYLSQIKIQSEKNWTISLDIIELQSSFDSIVISTNTNSTVYRIDSLWFKNNSSNSDFNLNNDSLQNKIKIYPNGDKIIISLFIGKQPYKDSVSFGSFPKAEFPALDLSKSIKRTRNCIGISPLFFDDGQPRTISLKGKIYDKFGQPVKNQLFYTDRMYVYYALYKNCVIDTFSTNNNGEFLLTDIISNQHYTRTYLTIETHSTSYFRDINIQTVDISTTPGNIKSQDIHLIDDLVGFNEKQVSGIEVYYISNNRTINFTPELLGSTLQIVSIGGVVVYQTKIEAESLPVGSLLPVAGVYFYRLTTPVGKVINGSFVKE